MSKPVPTTISTEWRVRKKRSSKDKEDEERCDQAKRRKGKSMNETEEKEMDDFMFGRGAEELKTKNEEDAIMSRDNDNVINGERATNSADNVIQLNGPQLDDEADDDIISTRKRCVRVLNLVNVLFEPAEVIERFAQYHNTSKVEVERWLTHRQSERNGEREEGENDIWMTLINWRKKTK